MACLVLDATQPFGRGDRFVAARLLPDKTVVVVNKTDLAAARRSSASSRRRASSTPRPTSPSRPATAAASPELLDHLFARLPEGPRYFPDDVVTDVPRRSGWRSWCASSCSPSPTHELPYAIATRVTEWEWPRIRVEILVERDSQKGMVIGKQGAVLKAVGTAAREQLPPGAFLELFVKVDKDWQRRPDRIVRLGY